MAVSYHHPPMIRTDASNLFAHHSMQVRVPGIIRDIVASNPDYPASIVDVLQALAASLENDELIPMIDLPAPDYDVWTRAYAAYTDATWLDTVWFFAETFCYRHIIQAVRWWETGRDPFLPQKTAELAGDSLKVLLGRALTIEDRADARLGQLLHHALWGNRIDLSLTASVALGGESTRAEDLLVNDTQAVIRHVLDRPGSVHLVADNAGTELALDLVLIDAVLRSTDDAAMLHLKMHPTFVSDATVSDVLAFLGRLEAGHYGPDARKLGRRLQNALAVGRLRLAPDGYWNSSRFLWDMPPRLVNLFQTATLVIFKGDANYRRLASDATWAPDTPFAEVVRYFPAPLVALRTLKSDVIAGLPPALVETLDNDHPTWRNDGRYGVIQSRL